MRGAYDDIDEYRRALAEEKRAAGVISSTDEVQAKRKAMAEKIGFDAYGVSEDMPDPVARAIGQLLDH